jgi:UDP-N-acetylglucosamine--dolichyl-phosphate N-acetylglucosaminephosphotransferase
VEPLLIIALLLSFFLTLFFMPLWIKGTKKVGLVGKDLHKVEETPVSEAGGVGMLFGFICGVLIYIAIKTFYFNSVENLIEIFAALTSILIISFVGLIDDVLGWKLGLTRKTRILFLIFAAIPLVVINGGISVMFGRDFGLLYPLVIIPLGIVGASATFNFIAGYNGLETSQGILILAALALVAWFTGNSWLSMVALVMVAALLAFYLFNKTPAKIFPGDALTYAVGALIAIMAILGNMERIAVFFFLPYIIETVLKVRGKLKKESFAKLKQDGSLDMPYKKIYGLEHLAIKILKKIKKDGKVYEREVVWAINIFQILVIILGFILFQNKIF